MGDSAPRSVPDSVAYSVAVLVADSVADSVAVGKGKPGKFAPYSCCFKCYAPQAICQAWEGREGQSGKWKFTSKRCQFQDIIMPVVVCMLCEGED
jgi:hypothetical protein